MLDIILSGRVRTCGWTRAHCQIVFPVMDGSWHSLELTFIVRYSPRRDGFHWGINHNCVPRHTAKALQRAISEASRHLCACKVRTRKKGREECRLTVCTNEIVHGQSRRALLNCLTWPTNLCHSQLQRGAVYHSLLLWFSFWGDSGWYYPYKMNNTSITDC